MKHPIRPYLSNQKPDEFLVIEDDSKESIFLPKYQSHLDVSSLLEMIGNHDPELVTIYFDYDENDSDYNIQIRFYKKLENHNYSEQLKIYNKAFAQYNFEIEKYNVEMQDYEKYEKKSTLNFLKQQRESLQNKIEKLEKEII